MPTVLPRPHEPLRIGEHVMLFEPPDVLVLKIRGNVSPGDVNAFLDVCSALAATTPQRSYLLADVSGLGELRADARKVGGARMKDAASTVLICFGGSFHQRMLAKLASTAVWLLGGRSQTGNPPFFVATEKEARAILADVRRAP